MHVLITGATSSGKTELAKRLCAGAKARGRLTGVLDPINTPYGADFQTRNPAEFKQIVEMNTNMDLFIDEGGEAIGRYQDEMLFLATRVRHRGCRSYFIAQRPKMINATARGQCSEIYTFRLSKKDAYELADEFSNENFRAAHLLGKLEYIWGDVFGNARHGKITFDN